MAVPTPVVDQIKAGREFDKKVAEALLDPRVQNLLVLDIDNFTKTTNNLTEKFRTVHNKLKEFDSKGLGDTGATPLNETWAGFETRFSDTLNESKKLAGEMADASDDYITTIVKPTANLVKSTDIQEAAINRVLKDIDFYVEDNAEQEKRAEAVRNKFDKLASDIKTFRDDFEKYGKGRQTANLAKIHSIDLSIGTLTGELNDIEGHIRRLGYAMVGTGVTTGVLASATAFFPLASLAIFTIGAIAVAGEGIGLAVLESNASAKRSEIKAKEKEKTDLKDENETIDQIRIDLKALGKSEVEQVLGGLEFFVVLWNEIIGDTQSIGRYLEKLKRATDGTSDPEEWPNSVHVFITKSTTLHYGLSRGLKLYQIGVERADTIKFGISTDD